VVCKSSYIIGVPVAVDNVSYGEVEAERNSTLESKVTVGISN